MIEGPLALFTDFGSGSIYIGQMHAAAAVVQPGVKVIDLFHDTEAFDVSCSGVLLAALLDQTPRGTVLVGVVDPGVGSDRVGLAIRLDERWLVGPDNGLFSAALARSNGQASYYRIQTAEEPRSRTFHGRDVFVPVAADLVTGKKGELFRIDDPLITVTAQLAEGSSPDLSRVIHVDRYGNVITGLRGAQFSTSRLFSVGDHRLTYAGYFAGVSAGTGFWTVNSMGLVEFAVNQGSAEELLGLCVGDAVQT
tara:strand:+ start:4705 stop:5457 length:753 start_codon:yes stop_codon:yes gene_type:complete